MFASVDLKKLLTGIAVLLAVLVPAALYLSRPGPLAVPTGSWGLSFR